ncbi:MAG: ABC-2 transporter permease [Clostridia bacterium]|nr:ABC-2 transporter permease [Clostridia bacterium]
MKSLLLKDYYVLSKQALWYLFIIICYSFIPVQNAILGFPIIFGVMLPITAVSYDERSKWDILMKMMPYQSFQAVFSKYILGYISMFAAGVISAVIQTLLMVFRDKTMDPVYYISLTAVFLMGCLIQAIYLPLVFRWGVEKARIIFYAVIAAMTALSMIIVEFIKAYSLNDKSVIVMLAVILLLVVLSNVFSIKITSVIYSKRE